MDLKIQIISLSFSFLYGLFMYFMISINYKYLFMSKLIERIVISILFIVDNLLLYFLILRFINDGIIHVYFLLCILFGYFVGGMLYKLIVKCKKIWYNCFKYGGGKMTNRYKNTNKKKKKIRFNANFRLLIAFIFFGSIIATLSYNLISNLKKINEMKKEKIFLEEQIVLLKEEEKVLESDIQKLEDPAYVARYAREKYLYSKEGEFIIKLPD